MIVETVLEQKAPVNRRAPVPDTELPSGPILPGAQPISGLQWRTRAKVVGRVKSIRVRPLADVPNLECVLVDGSGEAITLVFLGRRSIAGLHSGTKLMAEGRVGKHKSKLAIINPAFELLSVSESAGRPEL